MHDCAVQKNDKTKAPPEGHIATGRQLAHTIEDMKKGSLWHCKDPFKQHDSYLVDMDDLLNFPFRNIDRDFSSLDRLPDRPVQ